MTLRWNRWLCAILALVALAYALLPEGPPLVRASGSAFSAATSDVAIGCGVRLEVERRFLPDRPAPPPPPKCPVAVAVLEPVDAPGLIEDRNRSASTPVLLPALLTQLSPRAPPAA